MVWAWFASWAWAGPTETLQEAIGKLESGDEPAAMALLQEALPGLQAQAQAQPDDASAHFQLGQAQYLAGSDATASLARALELQPDHEGALYYTALLHSDAGRWDEAVAGWARLSALDPSHAEARWNHGQALQLAGRSAEARGVFEQVAEREPQDWRALSKVVQLCQALGDLPARDAALQRLRDLRASGTVPDLSAAAVFVRDQFDSPDGKVQVMALEHFALEGDRARLYVFALLDPASGQETAQISLGSYDATTAFARETGQIPADARMYHLDGYWPDGSHATYGFFEAPPSYDETRALVMDILQGTLTPSSSSTPAPAPEGKKKKRKKKKKG